MQVQGRLVGLIFSCAFSAQIRFARLLIRGHTRGYDSGGWGRPATEPQLEPTQPRTTLTTGMSEDQENEGKRKHGADQQEAGFIHQLVFAQNQNSTIAN